MLRSSLQTIRWSFIARIALQVALLSLGLILVITPFIPSLIRLSEFGADWVKIFRPAVLSRDPYSNPNFYNPPWVIILLAPIALLPSGWDMAAMILISIVAWIIAMRRLGASLIVILLMFMTPQLWWSIVYGNLDFLVVLGIILPSPLGLFFVLSKPQAGAGIAIYWLILAHRQGGWRNLLLTISPIITVSLLFCIPFGPWPMELFDAVTNAASNISIFPYLAGAGLILLIRSIKNRQPGLAIISGPLISPYIGIQSISVAVLGLLPSQTDAILVILSLWAAWLMRGIL